MTDADNKFYDIFKNTVISGGDPKLDELFNNAFRHLASTMEKQEKDTNNIATQNED